MKIEYAEVHWVEEQPACSLRELAEGSRLSEQELRELVELGVLQPLAPPAAGSMASPEPLFGGQSRVTLRALCRLRDDLELDLHGASVAVALLERIGELERELRRLRAHHPPGPRA